MLYCEEMWAEVIWLGDIWARSHQGIAVGTQDIEVNVRSAIWGSDIATFLMQGAAADQVADDGGGYHSAPQGFVMQRVVVEAPFPFVAETFRGVVRKLRGAAGVMMRRIHNSSRCR